MKTPKILLEHKPDYFLYLQASSNYTLLFTSSGEMLISSYNLQCFHELLDEHDFLRLNRSSLINKKFIERICPSGKAILKNKQTIPISRRRKPQLLSQHPKLFK